MERLWLDLRYAGRMMRRDPALSLLIVLTIGLAIGASTSIFSVVNGVLLRPLPYADPDRLVMLRETAAGQDNPNGDFSPANFLDLRDQGQAFSACGAFYPYTTSNLTGDGEPERLNVTAVSPEVIAALGVAPLLGRNFSADEMKPENARVVILSERLWRRRFGADPAILARSISLDGRPHQVVGVLPAHFQVPSSKNDLWLPLAVGAGDWTIRDVHLFQAVARLEPGVTLKQAGAELETIARRLAQDHPESNAGVGFAAQPLLEKEVGGVRRMLWVLLASVGFILLIACANVANLLLARASVREREMAVRTSNGATRQGLLRQLLTESLLLAILGGLLGLALAVGGIRLLAALGPQDLPRLGNVRIDGTVLALAAVLTLLCSLLFGMAPALRLSRQGLNDALKTGQRTGARRAARWLQQALAVAQIGLAVVLLTSAGLMLRSLFELRSVDPGFERQKLLTLRLSLPRSKYAEPVDRVDFFDRALERLASVPGVERAGAVNIFPLTGDSVSTDLTIEGQAKPAGSRPPEIDYRFASPGLFATLEVPQLAGRGFERSDRLDAPKVALISDGARRHFWPHEDPVGKRVKLGPEPEEAEWVTIIGVVGDVRYHRLDEEPRPTLYQSTLQRPATALTLVLATSGDPLQLVPTVRREISALDPNLPLFDVASGDTLFSRSLAERRFSALLLALFAGLALVLASAGIYGVLSYAVGQRRHEIGVRMALGSTRGEVLRLILGQGARLTAVALALGTLGALVATRWLGTLLYGVGSYDPWTFLAVLLLLALVALVACYLPARRGSLLPPAHALRVD